VGKLSIISNKFRLNLLSLSLYNKERLGGFFMITTLGQIQKTDAFSSHSLMALKAALVKDKKRGLIFFHEDLSVLLPHEPFHLLCYWLPGNTSSHVAFPVPLSEFLSFSHQKKNEQHLKSYYELFFQTKISDELFFHTYDLSHPFIGSEYVWYIKRIG